FLLDRIFYEGLASTRFLPPSQSWVSDGLSLSEPRQTEPGKIQLSGTCHWLSGGEGCERYRFDIDTSRKPYRYSFKLSGGRRDVQKLYIAKTDEGWFANAT
ncbi:MAG: hypothetical protein AAFY15_08845, partial [Cyanobacteria bacterium J06648_11]